MKKIIKGLIIFSLIILLSACKKDYKAITYTKFIEIFQAEEGYLVNNSTPIVDDKFERFIEASGKNNYFIFYEFETEKEARKYVSLNYKSKKYYSFKDKKDYIIVKSTKGRYFYLIQIDNTILIGDTNFKSNKKEIKRMFKKLGY